MIKSLHEITLKDVILLDATKKADSLKKYWFVPLWMCGKQLNALAKQIFDGIGGSTIDSIEDELDELRSYRKLQILEALYKAVTIEINLKTKINAWKIIIQKDYKESEQLEKILAEVLKHTGIDIKRPDDLLEFSKYLQFKMDKHQEMFSKPQEERQSVKLEKIIYSVFNFLGEPYNDQVSFLMFLEMKSTAEERVKKSKSTDNGQFTGDYAN